MSKHPLHFGMVLYALLALSLIPLSLAVGQYTWVGWGPFDFQLNRLFFYLFFFLLGGGLGTTDWQEYLFRQGKLFGLGWRFWLLLSIVGYGLVVLESNFGAERVKQGVLTPTVGYLLYDLVLVASCLASMGACLSFFRQKVNQPFAGWDSLSSNAYGIYIVHYGFVTWLQFALLQVDWPVPAKFALVFLGAAGLSWLVSSWVRRSAPIARIL